jgi:biotin operon repressor
MVAARLATLKDGQRKSAAEISAPAVSQPEAAKKLNVSRESIQAARKVLEVRTAADTYRRHLDEGQRGMVAARLATLDRGPKANAEISANAVSQPEAAKMLNVSRESVQAARKVLEHGADEHRDMPAPRATTTATGPLSADLDAPVQLGRGGGALGVVTCWLLGAQSRPRPIE